LGVNERTLTWAGSLSETFARIVSLLDSNEVRISEHGYDELADDGITVDDVLAGVKNGTVVEDNPDFPKGPCVLVLRFDDTSRPFHAVWIPKGHSTPAVLITAYRPDPNRWNETFTERRK
jgi:hypothetical protein